MVLVVPAYEQMHFDFYNLQVVNNLAYELELKDLFNDHNLTGLFQAVELICADSAAHIKHLIQNDSFSFGLRNDSLLLNFPNEKAGYGYYEFNEVYNTLHFDVSQFGRAFLSEKRRKRQLLKSRNNK